MPARRPLLACALVAVLSVTGCGPGGPAPAAPAPAPSPGAPGFFGGTDLAWVEINIAMNEELVPLLDLAPARSSDPAVRAYADRVAAFTNGELATLRALHDQARLPAANPHRDMPMPGMVTPEMVARAAAERGTAFDRLLLQHVREHLAQGTKLARSERRSGLEPQTKALAARVVSNRADALSRLGTLSGS